MTSNKKASAVSKKVSELWKALSIKDRQHWDDEAAKGKEQYMAEKDVYTGPWYVPHKRAKKVRFSSAICSKIRIGKHYHGDITQIP